MLKAIMKSLKIKIIIVLSEFLGFAAFMMILSLFSAVLGFNNLAIFYIGIGCIVLIFFSFIVLFTPLKRSKKSRTRSY
jgi:hypothetical protein